MKATIIYDSIFGNTASVAREIAGAITELGSSVTLLPVQEMTGNDLAGTDLLIVGSPTRGFRPTPAIAEFVEGLQPSQACRAAVFDTRIDLATVHPAPLRWVVETGGYAGSRIANSLAHHGFEVSGDIAGFEVTGTEGPLKEGELERARNWAHKLIGELSPA